MLVFCHRNLIRNPLESSLEAPPPFVTAIIEYLVGHVSESSLEAPPPRRRPSPPPHPPLLFALIENLIRNPSESSLEAPLPFL